jgi:hypothetical protein
MIRSRSLTVVTLIGLSLGASLARGQIVVTDPAVTARQTLIATLKAQLLDTATAQADRLRRMAERLSALTSLDTFALPEPPMWRIHLFEDEQFLYANPYHASLNYGDRRGAGFAQVARRREEPGEELTTFGEDDLNAEAIIVAQLATLDAADSAIIAATDQTGQLRYNGRKELAAIDTLEGDVLDASSAHSTTAVLDTLSAASLIRARQQQARLQLLAGVIEQLLVENKRTRDTEAAAMNMQLARLREGRAANTSLVAGVANDLRIWRQP